MATKMVGNDRSHHLRMFGEVSKPLSAEMSEIWIIGPNFNLSHYAQGHLYYSEMSIFEIFANYQLLSCFIQSQQDV